MAASPWSNEASLSQPLPVVQAAGTAEGFEGGDQRPIRLENYDRAWAVLDDADRVESGHDSTRGLDSIIAWKAVAGETYRAVYDIRPGRKTRALALVSLVVKTG